MWAQQCIDSMDSASHESYPQNQLTSGHTPTLQHVTGCGWGEYLLNTHNPLSNDTRPHSHDLKWSACRLVGMCLPPVVIQFTVRLLMCTHPWWDGWLAGWLVGTPQGHAQTHMTLHIQHGCGICVHYEHATCVGQRESGILQAGIRILWACKSVSASTILLQHNVPKPNHIHHAHSLLRRVYNDIHSRSHVSINWIPTIQGRICDCLITLSWPTVNPL